MTITSMDPFEIWARHHPDDEDPPGCEVGDECGRWEAPDEDCPKAYQCKGTMVSDGEDVFCDTCGETVK